MDYWWVVLDYLFVIFGVFFDYLWFIYELFCVIYWAFLGFSYIFWGHIWVIHEWDAPLIVTCSTLPHSNYQYIYVYYVYIKVLCWNTVILAVHLTCFRAMVVSDTLANSSAHGWAFRTLGPLGLLIVILKTTFLQNFSQIHRKTFHIFCAGSFEISIITDTC